MGFESAVVALVWGSLTARILWEQKHQLYAGSVRLFKITVNRMFRRTSTRKSDQTQEAETPLQNRKEDIRELTQQDMMLEESSVKKTAKSRPIRKTKSTQPKNLYKICRRHEERLLQNQMLHSMLSQLSEQEKQSKLMQNQETKPSQVESKVERKLQEEKQWVLERQNNNLLGYNPFDEERSQEEQELRVRTDPLPVIER